MHVISAERVTVNLDGLKVPIIAYTCSGIEERPNMSQYFDKTGEELMRMAVDAAGTFKVAGSVQMSNNAYEGLFPSQTFVSGDWSIVVNHQEDHGTHYLKSAISVVIKYQNYIFADTYNNLYGSGLYGVSPLIAIRNEQGQFMYGRIGAGSMGISWAEPYDISGSFIPTYKISAYTGFFGAPYSSAWTGWLDVEVLSDDPFSPGGVSGPGGGGMSGEPITSDAIDFPSVPNIGAVDAGFVSIWTPTEAQVKNLAHYLWTTDITEGAFWRKLIQNPLELIFGLQILPVPIYHTDETGDPQEGEYIAAKDAVVLGWTKTGIKMDYITDQYIEIDCGSIDMEEYWHAFLDYEPYTKIDIFLPYIGTKHLDTNDLMPRTLSLKYVIDIASGICVAMLKCDDAVYYQFTGNCASQIPLSVNQMQEIVKGAMSLAVGVATFALGGAYGAGEHAAKQAVQTGTAMKAAGAAMVGSGLNSAAKGVNVSRSGTISAAAGLMGVQTPYLIISRPRQAIPEDQSTYTGYPSFITEDLSELEGYTEIQMIHLHEMSCTEDEFNEIDKLLAAGVIF